jgi:small subunit ribosomal protein S8
MTPKILSSYEKANSENVKELLNRRQQHLKNASLDNDMNTSTVKGLYEKAKNIASFKSGFGMTVFSTPKGIMADQDAKKENLGGEILFSIW